MTLLQDWVEFLDQAEGRPFSCRIKHGGTDDKTRSLKFRPGDADCMRKRR